MTGSSSSSWSVPLLLTTVFWLPAIATVALSFTSWNGIGDFSRIKWIGSRTTTTWSRSTRRSGRRSSTTSSGSLVLFLVATPIGMFLAVLIDKGLRGSRFYQTALYMPVVLSLALIGFIWQLQLLAGLRVPQHRADEAGMTQQPIDFFGDPRYNLWAAWSPRAGGTSATSCCCTWRA